MCCGQSRRCPIAVQCEDAPKSYEYCTPGSHGECNFASSLHSIVHLNCEAYMQRIYAPPSHMPAWKFPLQITAKKYDLTNAYIG